MKYTKYSLLPLAAGALLYGFANSNEAKITKVKPEQPVSPPSAQYYAKPSPIRLAGDSDGIPYGLSVTGINDKEVTLRWNNPEPLNGYFDDFESHDDFVINSAGSIGWDYLDMDNQLTYTWSAATYPNQGQKMAFIIMNPSKTSPSTANWPGIQPYSGEKILVDFTVDGGNNDFIISPELFFEEDFKISFRAKSYTDSYGLERIKVGYSTSGKRASDFVFVSQTPYEEVPTEWSLMEYEIPKEAKYVTINCVSQEAFMLLIDDIFIGTNLVRPQAPASNKLTGFNIYRNGQKINDALLTEVCYTDEVPDYGDYTYTVTATYSDGSESAASSPLQVNVPDIRLLPFEDSFDNNRIEADKWSTPTDEQGNESRWSSDYYPYGLVDYSATYRYSTLTDYSQSLISRELKTPQQDNTYLRFELRAVNYQSVDGDTLSVELSRDNTTWEKIHSFCNSEGTFNWRVEQFDLSNFLTDGDLFRIRFRAHGESASYIDYWYVDDIKVWCPIWTTADLSVQSQGSPLANCPVTLTADHGSVINTSTDANGKINFTQIEEGTYTISIELSGYNPYSDTWTISKDVENRFTASVTRPSLHINETNIHSDLKAEETATHDIILKNEGDGPVHWTIEPEYPATSGDITHLWDIQNSFNASGDLQTAVVFDGENYYTASWYYLGKYFKYDKDGNFIEEFSIPGMYYKLQDLTFDGTYFYGSDYTNVIFQLDLRNKRLVREIVVKEEPNLKITHCSYDTRNDQFWVGGFNSIGRVNRDGNITVAFRNISTEIEIGAWGSAFDNISSGGPYLWFSNEEVAGTNIIDQIQIVQYNLNTRKVTQVSHIVSDVPGYQIGSTTSGPTCICGISTTTAIEDGTLSLVGILQQSPSRIFVYKLCDTNTWLSYTPKGGILESGEEQTVSININARNGVVGETNTINAKVNTIPELNISDITISYTTTAPSETPRPVNVTATTEGTSNVIISWDNGSNDKQPTGYNIYRNGNKINEEPIVDTQYTDTNLLFGNYTYSVTALYETDIESVLSDETSVYVKIGAPYYPPTGLTGSVSGNKTVYLSWDSPDTMQKQPATLRWDNGTNSDAIGMSDGGYFWGGVLWEYEDLINYRGMIMDSIDVFIQERYLSLTLQIFKDNQRILSQTIQSEPQYGAYNTIQLNNPITIEPGYSYTVAFLVAHDSGMRPLGIDNSTAINGKGNLISEDGKNWYPASHIGFETGNYNISLHLSPSQTEEETATGYNVYRNGERINDETVVQQNYTDEITVSGLHDYQVTSVYADGGESALSDAVQIEILNLGTPYAPSSVKAEVEFNQTIKVRWNFPIATESSFPVDMTKMDITCAEGHPEYVYNFKGYVPSEMGIASDGEHIYTSIYNCNGTINKYTLDGQFIESMVLDYNMDGIRNLTYNGDNFYASNNGNEIYKLDMENKTVTDTISISEVARHLTYIPDLDNGKGGFEVGDWETSIYVSMRGAKLGNGPALKGAAGTAYYNGILYSFEQGYEDPYMLCSYDIKTGEQIGCINLKDYVEFTPETNALAGGMSVVTTQEGLHLLAVALQESSNSRFIFFDLGSVTGLEGYNVYKNGVKINDEPLKYRYYTEKESIPGEYSYAVQTVFIDGSTSILSENATVEIYDVEHCDAPIDIKAQSTTYGYDVVVSFVDPTALSADTYESAEDGIPGQAFDKEGWENPDHAWTVTDVTSYEGQQALSAETDLTGMLIIPVKNYDSDFIFSFVARNSDDHKGNGQIKILTSVDGNHVDDFIPIETAYTTEAWKKYYYTIPAGTDYIALQHDAGIAEQYVDAICINSESTGLIYGYDILRDGKQLNETPITEISYTDHNLLPGTYTYQVRAYYTTSCISEFSEGTTIEVDYSNNCQKPGQLSAERTESGILLNWSAPALGDAINLKWHSGSVHDAAGLPSGGCFFAGVQWNSEELQAYGSLSLSEVEFYINQIPDALFLLVYEGNNLVHQQYVPDLKQYSFNTVTLDNPIRINKDKTLRVVIYVEHNEISVPLGYDEGPAKTGKGDLYSSDGSSWETLTSNDIDGNWNITIGLKAYAETAMQESTVHKAPKQFILGKSNSTIEPLRAIRLARPETSTRNTFDGYNLYCNSELLNDSPLQTISYTDTEEHIGRYYEYQVTAVYSGCGEVGSNIVRLLSTAGINGSKTENIRIYCKDARIFIDGLLAGTEVILFDTAGKVLHRGTADEEPQYIISTSSLPEGIYMIRAGKVNGKVIVSK